MIVKFVKPHSPYAEGDIAGIPDKEAEELIKAGAAVEHKKKDNGGKNESKENETDSEGKNLDQPAEDKMVKSPTTKK
ncbi:MAG: hypothetical protein HYT11_00875 [Candidatus Levybacteria bacterium]|nr:hypothetical protein [Candidatus Levybacteria bacterium]